MATILEEDCGEAAAAKLIREKPLDAVNRLQNPGKVKTGVTVAVEVEERDDGWIGKATLTSRHESDICESRADA